MDNNQNNQNKANQERKKNEEVNEIIEEDKDKQNIRYTKRDLKSILYQISKLSEIEHHGIFRILTQNDLPYTHNKNGMFINMSCIPHHVIFEIEKFVEFCVLNNAELDAHERKLNECRHNQLYTVSWGQSQKKEMNQCVNGHDNGDNMGEFFNNTPMVNNLGEQHTDFTDKKLNTFDETEEDHEENHALKNEIENEDENDNYMKKTCNDWCNLLNPKIKGNNITKQFTHHLEDNMENINKKKVNTKYTNAKKKFARKINSDKKQDFDISNTLTLDNYIL